MFPHQKDSLLKTDSQTVYAKVPAPSKACEDWLAALPSAAAACVTIIISFVHIKKHLAAILDYSQSILPSVPFPQLLCFTDTHSTLSIYT